jgi:hypothetical protein
MGLWHTIVCQSPMPRLIPLDRVDQVDDLLSLADPLGILQRDVTDPEPLPEGHALFAHPKCIVTPHLSGDTEREFEIAADIALENAERIRKGEKVVNLIDGWGVGFGLPTLISGRARCRSSSRCILYTYLLPLCTGTARAI